MDQAVKYIHNGMLLCCKNKIMPSGKGWMDLETIILSDVSQRDEVSYDITYAASKKDIINQEETTDIESKLVVTKGEGLRKDKWGIGD